MSVVKGNVKKRKFIVPSDGHVTDPHPLNTPSVKRSITTLVPEEVQNECSERFFAESEGGGEG